MTAGELIHELKTQVTALEAEKHMLIEYVKDLSENDFVKMFDSEYRVKLAWFLGHKNIKRAAIIYGGSERNFHRLLMKYGLK